MKRLNNQTVIDFWFKESTPNQWFEKNAAFDEEIRQRFGGVHQAASQGELVSWRQTIQGRLAEIIVLDQFSRNMFRNHPQSFAYDTIALVLAQEALATGEVEHLSIEQRGFLYMPFMHSESLVIHEEGMRLFSEPGLEKKLDFEKRHREIILRFGRYPHRNEILGRESTPAEIQFLTEPNSSF